MQNWEQKIKSEGFRIKYLRYHDRIIATIIYSDRESEGVRFGIAYCDPKKTAKKEDGRQIAYNRFMGFINLTSVMQPAIAPSFAQLTFQPPIEGGVAPAEWFYTYVGMAWTALRKREQMERA